VRFALRDRLPRAQEAHALEMQLSLYGTLDREANMANTANFVSGQ
jgi:hypothetical protein